MMPLHLLGWALLVAALLAYLAPEPARARLTLARAVCAAGGAIMTVLAFALNDAVLFGTGFTTLFACAGPIYLAWKRSRAALAEETSSAEQGVSP